MTDWHAVAAALGVELREEDEATVITALEKLERDFRPLQQKTLGGTMLWTGFSNAE